MEKDNPERRYRKSPGRQYGYDYDPLHSSSGSASQAGGSHPSRPGTVLLQRPDPRRTRQLMRKNIIDSKRPDQDDSDPQDEVVFEHRLPGTPPSRPAPGRSTRRFAQSPSDRLAETPSRRPASRQDQERPMPSRFASPRLPATRDLIDTDDEQYDEYDDYDDYNDRVERVPLEQEDDPYEAYAAPRSQTPTRSPRRSGSRSELAPRAFVHDRDIDFDADQYDFAAPVVSPEPAPVPAKLKPAKPKAKKTRPIESIDAIEPLEPGEDEYIYSEDEALPPGLRPVKKANATRRALLLGAGALVVGAGVYAVANVPHATTGTGPTTQNSQNAYNQGVTQGDNDTNKQWVMAMDNLEGFTLEGAVAAASLLRGTYDVIVSPVIKFGSTLSGDFLDTMLTAMKNARGYLAQVYQDNTALASIQKVLETWVDEVNQLPKQLDAITDTDLDGAKAYLQALQRKLDDEKKKLDATPTPAPNHTTPTPKSTQKPG